jgi:hypothetical protein
MGPAKATSTMAGGLLCRGQYRFEVSSIQRAVTRQRTDEEFLRPAEGRENLGDSCDCTVVRQTVLPPDLGAQTHRRLRKVAANSPSCFRRVTDRPALTIVVQIR